MVKRDPYVVLGVSPGASPAAIKAAWRRLARAHHPDVAGMDPGEARAATRRMAEINSAYEQLRKDGARRPGGASDGRSSPAGAGRRAGGPPPPKPTRPVTARLDTTDVLRPRNATTSRGNGRPAHPIPNQAPIRARVGRPEPPRASDPNGPLERSRVRRFRPPVAPPLHDARARVMPFGKFHGHTLGDIAAFEPSYIDWVSGTITRDPDLVAAARVIRDDLDRRGIIRRIRQASRPVRRPG